MFKFSRILVAYIIAVILAVILGFLVVWPNNLALATMGTVIFVLTLPLLLKWHHTLLIVFWSSAFTAFFLPAQPEFWLLLAVLSFGISFLNHIMFQRPFLRVPELSRPVVFLGIVVFVTAWYRGGLGVRALGGAAFGGRHYFYVFGAILGYFALIAEPVPVLKRRKMADIFFLSGTTFALGNLVYVLGPAFFFLFYLVPSDFASTQAGSENGVVNIERIAGLGPACIAALCFLLCRYGIRGLFDIGKPWRFVLLCLTVGAAFFAGFRSIMIMMLIIFAFQFYFEGLSRTGYLPIILGVLICGLAPILVFSSQMPPSVQRAISFLPVTVDSDILESAKGSSEWRFRMWADVWKTVPQYLLMGKGYSIDPTELMQAVEAARAGFEKNDYEGSMLAGDYHNGPLSILVPFGIFGVIGFVWVLIGGGRILYLNYRFGDAKLRVINITLLAYYLAYAIGFFFIFGAFNSELTLFLGVCGVSVSLNGGVKRKARIKQTLIPLRKTMLAPAR